MEIAKEFVPMTRLEEIEARVKKWREELPHLIAPELSHIANVNDFRYLLAYAASLEAEVKALRKLDTCTRGGLMWNTIVAKADAIARKREEGLG